MIVRDLQVEDLPAVTAIYAHHVRHGTGSFEEEPPTLAEMQARFAALSDAAYPCLVAERDGQVAGFAYAGAYKTRSAYRYTVEDSIYVAAEQQRQGIGALLLHALIERCASLGYRQMMAVIGDSDNAGSVSVHTSAGFSHVGTAKHIGYKFGRWLDIVYMQRSLIDPITIDEQAD